MSGLEVSVTENTLELTGAPQLNVQQAQSTLEVVTPAGTFTLEPLKQTLQLVGTPTLQLTPTVQTLELRSPGVPGPPGPPATSQIVVAANAPPAVAGYPILFLQSGQTADPLDLIPKLVIADG